MKLFVLGATGGIGGALVDQALARGHSVTAFVRSPQKLTRSDPRLTVLAGDPHNDEQLTASMPGHDAVLSSLGPRSMKERTVLRDCARSTIAAMNATGVQRLVIVSASLLFPDGGFVVALLRRFVFAGVVEDASAMERLVTASDLRWTVARPPRLTNGAGSGHYRAVDGHPPRGAFSMDRADVARFMLDVTEQDTHRQAIVGLGRLRGNGAAAGDRT